MTFAKAAAFAACVLLAAPHAAADSGQIEIGLKKFYLQELAPPGAEAALGGGLHLTLMHENQLAWSTIPTSTLVQIPPLLSLLPTALGDHHLVKDTKIKITCPDDPLVADVCLAWVFVYRCPWSCSDAYQGGIIAFLKALGWQHTRCAPHFKTGLPGTSFAHPMGGLRKVLARGESAEFDLPADSEFLAFSLDPHAVTCGNYHNAASCAATGYCAWNGETCELDDCHRGRGPPPPCLECPWLGLYPRPPSDGPYHLLTPAPTTPAPGGDGDGHHGY